MSSKIKYNLLPSLSLFETDSDLLLYILDTGGKVREAISITNCHTE